MTVKMVYAKSIVIVPSRVDKLTVVVLLLLSDGIQIPRIPLFFMR